MSSIQGHVISSRRALEAFLARYPLCYGYWKKFADLERRAGDNNIAEEVNHEFMTLSVLLHTDEMNFSELKLMVVLCFVRCVFVVSK